MKIVHIAIVLFLNLFAHDMGAEEKKLNVLILGGTTFLGPHLTDALLSRGHKVTHFNRGNANWNFPGVEKLKGDRDGNLNILEGRKWDAIIDTSGYIPRIVEASSKILAKATAHYTFISTISVYADFNQPHIDENLPLAKLDNDSDEKITVKTYGALKAGCEKVISAYFSGKALIVRPGLIVGPYDPSDRFTYWIRRIIEGGQVLVPDNPKQKLQIIDVRDLARWIVKMIEKQVVGIYNATGPKEKMCFEDFMDECSKFVEKAVEITWIDENVLGDFDWNKFPLCLPSKSNMYGLFCVDSKKAQDKGLVYRPISETIAAILDWDKKRVDRKMKVGLSHEEEKKLLNQCNKR